MSTTAPIPSRSGHARATGLALAAVLLLLSAGLPAVAGEMAGGPEARNKAKATEFLQVIYNQRQLDRIPDFVADDFVDQTPGAPPPPHGPAMVRRQADGTFAAFPDLKFEVQRMLAEGDLVAIHWSSRGHASAAMAGGAVEGKPATVQGISIFRYDDEGKIAESWDMVDRAGMMQELGFQLVPPGGEDAPGGSQ